MPMGCLPAMVVGWLADGLTDGSSRFKCTLMVPQTWQRSEGLPGASTSTSFLAFPAYRMETMHGLACPLPDGFCGLLVMAAWIMHAHRLGRCVPPLDTRAGSPLSGLRVDRMLLGLYISGLSAAMATILFWRVILPSGYRRRRGARGDHGRGHGGEHLWGTWHLGGLCLGLFLIHETANSLALGRDDNTGIGCPDSFGCVSATFGT